MPDNNAVFDRKLLAIRRARASRQGAEAFLLEHVAHDFAERLSVVLRTFDLAADIGTPGEALRNALIERKLAGRIVAAGPSRNTGVAADEETLPFANESIDLAVSALSLQFVNDLPGTLIQIRRALKPDGLFLAALLGGDTLTELRQAFAQAEAEIEGGVSPHVAPFADLRDLGALLQRAGFALPVTDVDPLIVRYADAFALMQDLRRMGATNVLTERRKKPLRRTTLLRSSPMWRSRRRVTASSRSAARNERRSTRSSPAI